ncbi:MAG: sulfate adenylyltransferase subunit CysN [Cellvibrionaceae bacterium]|nr:sulfate adenylyltransferase subunit CysN [Cellvibrionaceae bacterium]
MSHQSDLIATDINEYLAQHERKELLRFLTCGSVDDGKSTLIGRLLHDSKMIYEDQLAAVKSDSLKHGTTGEKIDLALLVDGLQAEREQGITIDVAYRYFSTSKRKFIIADTPGHEQYTRNMATGASTCDLAIILIDARHGVMTQTRRHSYIASLLGIRHLVVAINKMDLVDFDEARFNAIKDDYLTFAKNLGEREFFFVPISALDGDNVVNVSERSSWYKGQSLMQILETVEVSGDKNTADFRFPVQYVNRPNLDFRGFCGTVASGVIRRGDEIQVLPSGKTSRVKDIVAYEGSQEEAFVGQAVTLTLTDEIDISRGDMLVKNGEQASVTQGLKAHLVWMNEAALQTGKQYLFKFASKVTTGAVSSIDYRIDVNTQAHTQVVEMQLNDIAVVKVALEQKVVVDPYQRNRATGAFIMIDRLTNATVAAGMVIDTAVHQELPMSNFPAFELELNALIRKHFPHWQAVDLQALLKSDR